MTSDGLYVPYVDGRACFAGFSNNNKSGKGTNFYFKASLFTITAFLACLYVLEHAGSFFREMARSSNSAPMKGSNMHQETKSTFSLDSNAQDSEEQLRGNMKIEVEAQRKSLLSGQLSRVKNVNEQSEDENDIALFFHVPRSAGEIVKDIFSTCYLHLNKGEILEYTTEKKIIIINTRKPPQELDNDSTANIFGLVTPDITQGENQMVPTEDREDISLSNAQRLLQSDEYPDIIYSSSLYSNTLDLALDSASSTGRNLRLFTLIRHPIERSNSLFNYMISATWEPAYFPALAGMSLLEVVESNLLGDNFLTRSLTNTLDSSIPLSDEHLLLAEEVIRTKFLVGLVDEMDETWFRIRNAFGWSNRGGATECAENIIWRNNVQMNKTPPGSVQVGAWQTSSNKIEPNSSEWNILSRINEYDLRLYAKIRDIFAEQTDLFYSEEERNGNKVAWGDRKSVV